jgi:hypothetical protein
MPYVAALLLVPLARNPDGVATGRVGVVTAHPYIAVSVPAMKSRNPDEAVPRCGDDFDRTGGRWSNADDDLCIGSADRKEESARCDQNLLLHISFS